MKIYIFILCALLISAAGNLNAQQQINVHYRVMNQAANSMVYDSFASKILITIPSSDAVHGNSIGFVNPDSATLSGNYFIGSEPSPMDITRDGKYAYVGLAGASLVKQFNLNTKTTGLTINLGANSFFGPKMAASISCMPGSDSVISVVESFNGTSPPAAGVFIFSNGNQLPDSLKRFDYASVAHFYDSSALYAYNSETSGYDFYTTHVNNQGLTQVSDNGSLLSGGTDFFYAGQYAISFNGMVVDISLNPYRAATIGISEFFPNGNYVGCYDHYQNLACFAFNGFWGDTVYIERFNLNNFLQKDEIVLTGFNNGVTSLISWGDSTKLAFSTGDGHIVIINGIAPTPNCNPITANFAVTDRGNGTYSFADKSYSPDANAIYNWTINNAVVSSSTGFSHTFSVAAGDTLAYTVCESIIEPGCTDTAYICRQLYASLTNPSVSCAGILQQFDSVSTSDGVYTFTDSSLGLANGASCTWWVNGVVAGSGPSFNYTFYIANQPYTVCETISQTGCAATSAVCEQITGGVCKTVNQYFSAINHGNGTLTFTDSSSGTNSSATYEWDVNGLPVSSSSSFTYTFAPQSTDYRVCEYIDEPGCSYTGPLCINYLYTGIESLERTNGIFVYPNPASTALTVNIGNLQANKIELFDNIGQLFMNIQTGPGQKTNLDLTAIPSGLYMISIYLDDNEIAHRMFIVSK